ncbi:apolipoprotein N-acyltransferase [Paraglaciecola hydrolytica]|uniref:Apolipoprotein N-acyltransferase n=1 Tax=Paraglaciecola hydrolytica TaxID=1799789 RepID=A0A136A2K3_9ALTE|nr:apolipoprotein N-acyltransferase [Paraglaciecola hydrolytica]
MLRLLVALILGGLLTLGYAPFSQWWLVPIACTAFIYLLTQTGKTHSFKLGFAYGLGWFGAGISWVHVSIADFGGLPLIGSLSLMLLLCGYLALFPATLFYLLTRYFKVQLWPLALPFMWLVMEWLRATLFTGFPWLSLGYSQLHGPLSGWFPLVGEIGVSSLLVLLCGAAACWLLANIGSKGHRQAGALIIATVVISGLTLEQHPWVKLSGKAAKIAMVQGNIQQDLRWVPEQDLPTMLKYQNMSNAHWDADVIIWPEAAVPKLEPAAVDYLHKLDKLAVSHNSALITGIVNYNFETREAYNNLLTLGLKDQPSTDEQDLSLPRGQYYYGHGNRYAKHHLLPIGEFIPLENWLRKLAPIFDLPMSSFSRGEYQQANLRAKGYYFAPAICFEIAFPNQIAANLYEHTNFIITVSNDAWFGHSHGPDQHLEIAQVRAKEFGLPVLRATNNGISAFIDYRGQIQSRLPQFEAAVLSDTIPLVQGNTPYRLLGNWPMWLLCLLSFSAALYFKQKESVKY